MKVLEDTINDVSRLENSQARARTVGYLCHIALDVITFKMLEDRIKYLEDKANV